MRFKRTRETDGERIELGLIETPTSMDAIVTGYKDELFCIGRCGRVDEAESLAKEKGLEIARFFWFPQGENTIPMGYSEVRGWKDNPETLRADVIKSLGSRGIPIHDELHEIRHPKVRRVARY